MAEEVEMEYCVLNIAATPHPRGIYPNLLTRVAKHYVNFHGRDSAQLTPPDDEGTGIHTGRILVWTDLDPNDPAIDKIKAEEIALEDTGINVPPAFGINGRTFFYALREKDHRLFYEAKNEQGKHLSPYYLKKILDKLFASLRNAQVAVTVEPEDDALDQILAIPVLTNLEIYIAPPNADDNDKEMEAVMKEMKAENISLLHEKLKKRKGKEGIKPSKRRIAQARVAASNGYVKAKGRDGTKQPIELSTAEYPKKMLRKIDIGSITATLMRVARTTIFKTKDE
jgi:hypothetical protein